MIGPRVGEDRARGKVEASPQDERRRKLLSDRNQALQAASEIQRMLADGRAAELPPVLAQYYPPDLADVMFALNDEQDRLVFNQLDPVEAAAVLDELDDTTRQKLVQATTLERLAQIVAALPVDEGVDVLSDVRGPDRDRVLGQIAPERAEALRSLLAYPCESAGGIMALGFVAVPLAGTVADALAAYRGREDAEPVPDVFAVDAEGRLAGAAALRQLLNAEPATPLKDIMQPVIATATPDMDREQVARIFARYNLMALPVVEQAPGNKLIGLITANDVIDVIQAEGTEDALRLVGSDAEEMEKRSPAQTALLRLPWIMATMFIELGAGFVIHHYDATLAHVILLASFMPIISAISGNTGLQSATIIVRGLSAGQVQVSRWQHAVARQLGMTLILGAASGLVIGIIGAVWYGKWLFGLVVGLGMFTAVNIAGFVGTVVPLMSKRLGFDPAITSGPFETAFQDVVGISIFLSLATVLLNNLMK